MTDQLTLITDPTEMTRVVEGLRIRGKKVGCVPTMGALHAGHLSLARASVEQTDVTVATIFVNPTQFAPGEDLDKYPRQLAEDADLLAGVGVNYLFCPQTDVMYPPGSSTSVLAPKISKRLEGEFRPTHFGGVATIVLKLLNIVGPHVAYFGQKDYQQVAVIRKMVTDLNVPVEIVACPIIRDPDGLAMSSRNVYLSAEQRQIALSISGTLREAKERIESGNRDGYEMVTEMRQRLIDSGVTSIDYVAVANPDTLETADPIELPVVLLIAVYVGKTRLIDNCIVDPS